MADDIPFNKTLDLDPETVDEVAPGVRRVMCNNPGPFTFKGTVSYIIGRGKVAIVERLGEVTLIYVDVGAPEPIVAKIPNDTVIAKGDTVALTSERRHLKVFDENGVAYPRT